jgi:NOL1/NOP2/fmu family ribosome biogenesis protein/precorrin-6B methylase 2
VQEASSMFLEQMVAPFLAKVAAPIVLDFCAAPGGKSSHLLALLEGKGLLVANEIIANRNAILRENLTKWGVPNYVVTQGDATQFAKTGELFDLIVIDAPCSGEGMFRKDKRAIDEWSIANVAICVERQTSILNKLVQCLKPGGMLVYSTCTFEPDENINQLVELCKAKHFKSTSIDFDTAKNGITVIEKESVIGYQFYPHKSKGEGFFIAALKHSGEYYHQTDDFTFQNRYHEISHLISPTPNCFVRKENDTFYLTNFHFTKIENALSKAVKIKTKGTQIALLKGTHLIPSPEWAFCIAKSNQIATIEIDKTQAINFLRCENIHFPAIDKGWYLVTYQGLGLGWVKVMDNRTNNYYPSNWRILK